MYYAAIRLGGSCFHLRNTQRIFNQPRQSGWLQTRGGRGGGGCVRSGMSDRLLWKLLNRGKHQLFTRSQLLTSPIHTPLETIRQNMVHRMFSLCMEQARSFSSVVEIGFSHPCPHFPLSESFFLCVAGTDFPDIRNGTRGRGHTFSTVVEISFTPFPTSLSRSSLCVIGTGCAYSSYKGLARDKY
jgi:hypothetical protein